MSVEITALLLLTLYKLASLTVGFLSLYMGYRLFMNGIWGNAGEAEANFQNNRIVIKRAAPGTFFALFGTIILCFTIFSGLKVEQFSRSVAPAEASSPAEKPQLPPLQLQMDEKAPSLATPSSDEE